MSEAATQVAAPVGANSAPAAQASARFGLSRKALISVSAAALLAVAGVVYIVLPNAAESTDNAYIQADSSVIAPKVRGLVAEVLVQHNQIVTRGMPLVQIDPEEFDARVASASADLQDAESAVAAVRAALVSLDSEELLAGATVEAARTSIRSADAQSKLAEANRKRYDDLVGTGAVSRLDNEQYRASAVSAQADADKARAQLDVARNQAAVIHAKRSTLLANLQQAEATVARARATLDLAKQDLAHTVIRAPVDGVVGDRQVAQGDYVQPGTRLLTIVPISTLYVVANFKETQTARMMAGQIAEIKVDALPGVKLQGEVESFAPGSGSQFALLPFEPGTGNFTKIVQRVPVRIRFDEKQNALARLRPGLSTTVTVRFKDAPRVPAGSRQVALLTEKAQVAAVLGDARPGAPAVQ